MGLDMSVDNKNRELEDKYKADEDLRKATGKGCDISILFVVSIIFFYMCMSGNIFFIFLACITFGVVLFKF